MVTFYIKNIEIIKLIVNWLKPISTDTSISFKYIILNMIYVSCTNNIVKIVLIKMFLHKTVKNVNYIWLEDKMCWWTMMVFNR